MAIATTPINNVFVGSNSANTTINLATKFDDNLTTGLVAHFRLFNPIGGSNVINVLLFDQAGSGAPLSVSNFQNYVSKGSYANTIIHRSITNFVVQGGGFTINNLGVGNVLANAPVQNEFSSERSNLRGTIAFAKVGGDPNSATNQWFFNLGNNSANLDNQNGGFTVFGQVISSTDLATLDAIASVPIYNGSSINPAFTNIPLIVDNPAQPRLTSDNNFIRFSNIDITQESELTFAIAGNSNPSLVNATITNQQLALNYLPNQTGSSNISIRATNLLGQSVESQFSVTVSPSAPFADLKKDPAKYMELIRDYDGNNLGGSSSWKLIGEIDVQGDGDLETLLVNPKIERWATVGSVDGIVNFGNNGLGGDTRVVGIYIDPTLKDKPENIGGPFDSQRRFQNDLRIDNLSLLGGADYDKDGFQDVYFKVNDGSAVLRGLMHKDGNIQYANYQSKADLTSFMTANGVSSSIWGGWI